MKRCLRTVVFTLVFVVTFSAWAVIGKPQGTLKTDEAQWHEVARQARLLLLAQRFQELEKIAMTLRSNRAKHPSGRSRMSAFYAGMSRTEKEESFPFEKFIALQKSWLKATPRSVTARVALGSTYIDWAWQARGSGWASSVTQEGWKLFVARLAEADRLLHEAESYGSDALLYALQITVAMGRGLPREAAEKSFQKAVALDPDDLYAYGAMALYLTPRWYGEPGDYEAFVDRVVKMTEKRLGQTLYAYLATAIAQRYGGTFFKETTISWPRVKTAFEDWDRHYPNSALVLNCYAYLAVLADDRETTREVLNRVGSAMEIHVWRSAAYFQSCRKWSGLP